MNIRQLLLIAFAIAASLVLEGCSPTDATSLSAAAPATADVFGAQQVPAGPNETIVIEKTVAGPIYVVAYPSVNSNPAADEVALDYIVVGQGRSHEEALQAARQQRIDFGRGQDNRIRIDVPALNGTQNTVQLFVRVPKGSSLIINSTVGDIAIAGPVQNVAARLASGNIEASGVMGDAILGTDKGNIRTAQRSTAAMLVLNTMEGNITTYAVNAEVEATVGRQGSIRFVGTLREVSNFNTKGDGNVTVVLPDTNKYAVHTDGGKKVTVDYNAEMEVCSASKTSDYRYEMGPTDDLYGRIELSEVISGSPGVVDTFISKNSYILITDRPHIIMTSPNWRPMSICNDPALVSKPPEPSVKVNIAAEQGLITVRYIDMKP